VSTEVKGHIMKEAQEGEKTDGHIWAEIKTKVTYPDQHEGWGFNNKITRPRPSVLRFNCH